MALTTIDDRGLKTPIDLLDNEKIRFGTGNDLELYHDGTDSYINNATNELIFKTGSNFEFQVNASEVALKATANGAVEVYYDNVWKLKTASNGVHLNDSLFIPDSETAHFGNGDDLQIYHDGNNSYIYDSGTGSLILRSSRVSFNDASNNEWGRFDSDGLRVVDSKKFRAGTDDDLQIYHNGSHGYITEGTGNLKISAASGPVQILKGSSEDLAKFTPDGSCELYYDNSKKLETVSAGINVAGYVNVQSAGDIFLEDNGKIKLGTGTDMQIYHDGTHNYIVTGSASGGIYIDNSADADQNIELKAGQDVYLRVSDGTETAVRCERGGKVYLYNDNALSFTTEADGICARGTEGNNANVYLFADEGDDQPDQWRIRALAASSTFEIQNRNTNASYDTNIVCTGDGKVALNYDNAMKIETKTDGVTIQGDIGFVHAGNGLDFGANSHASGMSSEKFDQYEDGTWTPTLHNGTTTTAHCYYRLIGRQCTLWGRVSAMSDTSTNDMVKVQSLPFTPQSSWAGVAGGVMASYISEEKPWQPYVDTTASGQIRFYASHSGGFHQLRHNELNTSHEIYFMVTYPIA